MLMTIYEWMFFCVYILSLVYLLLHSYVYYFSFHKKQLVYREFLEYVVNARDSKF